MPRSILLGRAWPKPGEPLFLPDDTDGALELQADEDHTCPRGHHLDEPPGTIRTVVCEACAMEDSARRQTRKDIESYGESGDDLLDGTYIFAVPGD